MAKRKPSRPQTGANDIAAKAEPFIRRIEHLLDEKKVYCDGCADDIKEVYGEAEESGIPPKNLRFELKQRKQERDRVAALEKMTLDERAYAEALRDARAAERFGENPMGQYLGAKAALVMPNVEIARPDEGHLSHMGRGDVIDELTER